MIDCIATDQAVHYYALEYALDGRRLKGRGTMTTGMTVNARLGSTGHRNNIFDQSLADQPLAVMCDGRALIPRRRSLLQHLSAVDSEQRTASEVANALAAVWNGAEQGPRNGGPARSNRAGKIS